jgi:uncharacterized protein YecT (DUF1311 family)
MILAAMSLSVALCARMPDEAKKQACLQQMVSDAITAVNGEERVAIGRVGKERGDTVSEMQQQWLEATAAKCKAGINHDGGLDTESGNPDLACLIEETDARIMALKQLGYSWWVDTP